MKPGMPGESYFDTAIRVLEEWLWYCALFDLSLSEIFNLEDMPQ